MGEIGCSLLVKDDSRGELDFSGEGRPPDEGGDEEIGRGILLGDGEVTFSGERA